MKKATNLIVVMLIALLSFGQNSVEKDKELIKKLISESFDEIFSDLKTESINKYYTDDFLLLEHGEVWTNDTIIKYLDAAKQREKIPTRVNTFDFIEIKISNKMAWVAYHNYATFTIDNKVVRDMQWLESASAILTEKGWKLQMLHSTRIQK